MKYIKDIREGEQIVEHYLCKQKQILKTRAGKTYYSVRLQDKTGTIDGKIWDLNNGISEFQERDYIKIEGLVVTFQNECQLNIRRVRKSEEGEYAIEDYIPSTDKNIEEMYTKFLSYIEKVEDKYIKQLLEAFFIEDKDFIKKFKLHSAAKNIHHSYMGGLLEHTLSVLEICDFLSGRYENINKDLLFAGAIFHDIGKMEELSQLPFNEYSDDGQLIGHVIIGTEMIHDKAKEIEGFPHETESLIKHFILSHHGELEYGSPKVPQTIEAMLIHCADNTDAKLKCFEEVILNDKENNQWTGYHRMLQRNIRKTT